MCCRHYTAGPSTTVKQIQQMFPFSEAAKQPSVGCGIVKCLICDVPQNVDARGQTNMSDVFLGTALKAFVIFLKFLKPYGGKMSPGLFFCESG